MNFSDLKDLSLTNTMPTLPDEQSEKIGQIVSDGFKSAHNRLLDQCQQTLDSIKQTCVAYEKDRDRAIEQLARLSNEDVSEFDKDVLLARRQRRVAQHKFEQMQDDDQPLLEYLQQLVQDENYRDALGLAEDYVTIVEDFETDVHVRRIQRQVQGIINDINSAFAGAVQQVRHAGTAGGEARTQALHILESEILKRYPDYEPARELQKAWEIEAFEALLRSEQQAFMTVLSQIDAIQQTFWSADVEQQAAAVADARSLDIDSLHASSWLAQAVNVETRLVSLFSSADLSLQRYRQQLQEQQMRRRLVWLRALLYRNELATFDAEIASPEAEHILMQELRNERQAFTWLHQAIEALAQGNWAEAEKATQEAGRLFASGFPRINALAQQAQQGIAQDTELEQRIAASIARLEQLESDLHESDRLLEQENDFIKQIQTDIAANMHAREEHTHLFGELTSLYQRVWQALAERMLEHWRPEAAPEVIPQLERLADIAPSSEVFQKQSNRLRGRAWMSQAYQEMQHARLETARHLLEKAEEDELLTPDDRQFRLMQRELEQRKQSARESLSQAGAARDQQLLSQAYTHVQTALAINQEDLAVHDLQQELESMINAVRAVANDAYAMQTDQPGEALQLWEEVCERYQDGIYPSEHDPYSRPFIEWRDVLRQRIDESQQSFQQARQVLRQVRDVLAGKKKPDWVAFDNGYNDLRQALEAIDSAMRNSQWNSINVAAGLLQCYRDVYQRLEELYDSDDEITGMVEVFQAAYEAIQQFDGGTDPELRNLADVVQASFERMRRLIRYR